MKIRKNISIFMLMSVILATFAQPGVAAQRKPGVKPVPSTAQASGPSDPTEFEAFLDEYLAKQMSTHHIPGAVFTMVKDGEVFLSKAYGYADLED